MFKIVRNNIHISNGDNAIFKITLCNENLKQGDKIVFESPEQTTTVTEFIDGEAYIQIDSYNNEVDGNYTVRAIMADGRNCVIAEGKYLRKGGRK